MRKPTATGTEPRAWYLIDGRGLANALESVCGCVSSDPRLATSHVLVERLESGCLFVVGTNLRRSFVQLTEIDCDFIERHERLLLPRRAITRCVRVLRSAAPIHIGRMGPLLHLRSADRRLAFRLGAMGFPAYPA